MHVVGVYAISLASIILLRYLILRRILCLHFYYWVNRRCVRSRIGYFLQHRRRWLMGFTFLDVLLQLGLLAANFVMVFVRSATAHVSAQRAGYLAIVNLALFTSGLGIQQPADWLGLTLLQAKYLHSLMILPFVALVGVHATVLSDRTAIPKLPPTSQSYGSLASILFCFIVVLCLVRFLRQRWYEVFLYGHQLLTLSLLFCLFMHVKALSRTLSPTIVMLSLALPPTAGLLVSLLYFLVSNRLFLRGFPTMKICRRGEMTHCVIGVPFTVRVHAGQYINLWIPRISLWQIHPFVVIALTKPDTLGCILELLAAQRGSWTQRLHEKAQMELTENKLTYRWAVFGRPHGPIIQTNEYGLVLLLCSGWGILSQLPFLQNLVDSHISGSSKARRVRLVWQLGDINSGLPVKDILDQALLSDRVGFEEILSISIYTSTSVPDDPGIRVNYIEGSPDWAGLIEEEAQKDWIDAQFSRKKVGLIQPDGLKKPIRSGFCQIPRKNLVLTSASSSAREQINAALERHMDFDKIELDFQA